MKINLFIVIILSSLFTQFMFYQDHYFLKVMFYQEKPLILASKWNLSLTKVQPGSRPNILLLYQGHVESQTPSNG